MQIGIKGHCKKIFFLKIKIFVYNKRWFHIWDLQIHLMVTGDHTPSLVQTLVGLPDGSVFSSQ